MIQLIKGDCLEVMKTIPDGSIDAIITDPPYGTTQCKWDSVIDFDLMWEQLNRIIKPNGAILLFGQEPFSSFLRTSNITKYRYDWIWNKLSTTNFVHAKRMPLSCNECISVFYNLLPTYNPQMTEAQKNKIRPIPQPKKNNSITNNLSSGLLQYSKGYDNTKRYPKKIIEISSNSGECNTRKRQHPTQKPIELMEYLIKTYTNEGETVLDFTMGSGSTGVACVNTNRGFVGIEMDDNYFDISEKRIKEANYKLF